MSVPSSQLNSVRQSVSLQQVLQQPVPGPVPQQAANDVRMHPAEDALPAQPMGRTEFVSVKNLHQGDGLLVIQVHLPVAGDEGHAVSHSEPLVQEVSCPRDIRDWLHLQLKFDRTGHQ